MHRALVAIISPLPLILGCAMGPASADPAALTPSQSDFVAATCSRVMGLRAGDVYFADCEGSLGGALARKIAAESAVAADDMCRRQGLRDGTSEFAGCVLNSATAASAPEAPRPLNLTPVADQLQNGKSFYNVSSDVRTLRERYACAQLGLTPDSFAFGSCVASLEGNFISDMIDD